MQVPDGPTKMEILGCVAAAFNNRDMLHMLHGGGVYVPVARDKVQATYLGDEVVVTAITQHTVYVGLGHGKYTQEVYAAYGGKRQVVMTYTQALALANVLPELQWENI